MTPKHVAVKEAVFPFAKFAGVDTMLGPEMRSTGEVMGIDTSFAAAFGKSQIGAGTTPADARARAFLSVQDSDKAGRGRASPRGSSTSASRCWPPRARTTS